MSKQGATVSIHKDQFETLIQDNEIVFVDFWASWCAPCKQFSECYESVSTLNPAIIFAKVNIEEDPELAELFEIRSIPHLMVFKRGIAIYSEAGSMPESTLKELVQQAITVDVSAIVNQIGQEDQ